MRQSVRQSLRMAANPMILPHAPLELGSTFAFGIRSDPGLLMLTLRSV